MPNELTTFFQEHQSEIVAVVVGMLGALALLALLRKAIKLFVILAIGAAVIAAWWLSRTNDVAQQLQDLFSFIN
jgi:4-hydroxybenzoate polyprenyltransferase